MVLTAPLIDGVDDEGDDPLADVARGQRFGLVLESTPTKQPSQLAQDNLHVSIVGLEALSTTGAYELCLDSSPDHPFLDRGCLSVGSLLYGV